MILGRFWVPKVPKRHQVGVQNGAKVGPKTDQIEDKNCDAKRSSSRSSWGGLGVVLGRSWGILAALEAILGRFGAGWRGQNR